MTCKEFWNAETHSPEHLNECPACQASFARQQELAAGLRKLGAQMKRAQAPDRVERALVAAFRGQTALGGATGRSSWWLAGAWAAALAATALLAVTLMRTPHQPQRTRRSMPSRMQLAMATAPELPPDSEAEGEFLPLPNAAAVEPNEDVDMVRIELPRSAMIPLGYTVPAERASETVEADVMLDANGVARAVRFVNLNETTREISW